MADYYTQTSFAIHVSEDEAALINEIDPLLRALADGFETAAEAEAAYAATSAQFQAAFPKGADGDPFFELTSLFDDPTWPTIGCDLEARQDSERSGHLQLWVNGDDVRPFDLAALLQRVCPSALPFRFGWAYTCSRHRIDAFGGGYMEVGADRIIRLIDPDDPVQMKRLVLAGRDAEDGLTFWNNDTGFGALVSATVFGEAEAQKVILPVGADRPEWLELPAAPSDQGA
jgi:hypothetical protein